MVNTFINSRRAAVVAGLVLGLSYTLSALASGPTKKAPLNNGRLVFDFPPDQILAEIIYPTTYRSLNGAPRTRMARVLARGKFTLPVDAQLQVFVKPEALDHLSDLEKLKSADVRSLDAHNQDFDNTHMVAIKDFRDLRFLDLYGTIVGDQALETIGNFNNLTFLKLSRTRVTGTTFGSLARLKNLKIFSCANAALKPGSVPVLKPIAGQLTYLDIGCVNLKKEDLSILPALKQVLTLDISNNNNIDDDCVKYLAHLRTIKTLYIQDTHMSDKSLPVLLKLPALERIFVRDKTFWRTITRATYKGRLKIIDIADISDAPIEAFDPLH